jgi:two-component system, chemotaxis family, CheB/CheR fusion protein
MGPPASLTIVALGASAGGLEALQGFFGAMPADPRLAFVVITHLAPQHDSHMAELLGRASAMPVTEATEGVRVEAGHVYVIPPGCLMDIRDGTLRLGPPATPPASLRTIDHFMCALAEDQQERSAGIVLSGADHDGTAGLKEIKAAGGLTLAQDPETAKFPSMPHSVIEAGVPDRVLPVDRMGQALLDYLTYVPTDPVPDGSPPPPRAAPEEPPGMTARLHEVLALVHARTGHDFRWYRPAMLLRRLRRRMGLNRVGDVSAYLELLQQSRDELTALVKDFLISVTDFFREPKAWRVLEEDVIPALVRDRAAGDTGLRVWTPGCATGEESYSIAMVLLDQLGALQRDCGVCVFASDLDSDALAVARAGAYPEAIAATVPVARLARYFEKRGDRYVVRKRLREAVVFAPQNLVRDPPYSKLDLIVCRNLLIYFEPAQQSRILELFHFALNPGGVLFLGKSESLGTQAALFEPVSREHRIFRRASAGPPAPGVPGQVERTGWISHPGGQAGRQGQPRPGRAHARASGRAHVAAAVLINRDSRALYFHGETGRYLQPAGEPTWDLLALAREGCACAFAPASDGPLPQGAGGLPRGSGEARRPLRADRLARRALGGLRRQRPAPGVLRRTRRSRRGTPRPTRRPRRTKRGVARTGGRAAQHPQRPAHRAEGGGERQRGVARRPRGGDVDERGAAVLQRGAGELQGRTAVPQRGVVHRQQRARGKLAELERALNDLRNLMDSTRVATLFLDRELRIRRFTSLRPSCSTSRLGHGRPMRDIASRVVDPDLLDQARGVLEREEPVELEVRTREGEWYLRRILPFRTAEGSVEGVVVTYVDITSLRQAAQEARRLAAVLRDSNDAVIVYDFDGRILSGIRGAKVYGYRGGGARTDMASLAPARSARHARSRKAVRQAGSAGPETPAASAATGACSTCRSPRPRCATRPADPTRWSPPSATSPSSCAGEHVSRHGR